MESSDSMSAIMVMATIWLVYALVDATPISQPALMCTPQCVRRAMAEPTVLVTPMSNAPRDLAYSSACRQQLVLHYIHAWHGIC